MYQQVAQQKQQIQTSSASWLGYRLFPAETQIQKDT